MLSGVLPANCIIKVICISYRYSAIMFERQNRSGIILSETKKDACSKPININI